MQRVVGVRPDGFAGLGVVGEGGGFAGPEALEGGRVDGWGGGCFVGTGGLEEAEAGDYAVLEGRRMLTSCERV